MVSLGRAVAQPEEYGTLVRKKGMSDSCHHSAEHTKFITFPNFVQTKMWGSLESEPELYFGSHHDPFSVVCPP